MQKKSFEYLENEVTCLHIIYDAKALSKTLHCGNGWAMILILQEDALFDVVALFCIW